MVVDVTNECRGRDAKRARPSRFFRSVNNFESAGRRRLAAVPAAVAATADCGGAGLGRASRLNVLNGPPGPPPPPTAHERPAVDFSRKLRGTAPRAPTSVYRWDIILPSYCCCRVIIIIIFVFFFTYKSDT